jgi:hypothetical protein
MQIFKSKLAKTETATVQLNADEIAKLKNALGTAPEATKINLINGVSMRQLPNRWFTVEADSAPVSKVERIEAALQLIEKCVVHNYSLNVEAPDADEAEKPVQEVVHGGGRSHKTPPSQLLIQMFSRLSF